MAITKEKKGEIVEKLQAVVTRAVTLVFVNFKGLTVAQQTEMRRVLAAQGISYTVAKKTLMKRALTAQSYQGEMPELGGEIALVSGQDALAPARELSMFIKKFPEQLAFAGGVFGGAFVSPEKIKSIGAIPPLETLRAQFVQLINSPLQRFAVVVNEKAKQKS